MGISKSCCQVDGPVTEAKEEFLGLFVAGIHPGIAQTCIHLMDIVVRYPCTIIGAEITFLIVRPDAVTAWYTAYIAFTPLRVILGVSIGTCLQFADHIFHQFAALFTACCGIDGHGCQVMSTYVSVKSVPVRERWLLRGESGLLEERGQQAVNIILQQRFDV